MPLISNKPIQLLIADDHEMLREGFHTMLAKYPLIQLVGEAEDGKELVKLATQLRPDVIITDIKMPKMDGIEATRQILRLFPAMPIIAFTMFDEQELIVDMLEAGAQGYLIKTSTKLEILEAIRAVREGKTYYCSQTSAQMALMLAQSRVHQRHPPEKPHFSDREVAVIRLICEELTNKEIAHKLGISIRTVESHRERIQEKMMIRNTAGVVVYAIREGIYKV